MTEYVVRIAVRVSDPQELYEAARQTMAVAARGGANMGDPDKLLRDDACEVSIRDCLAMVFDPGMSPPGTEIIETEVEAVETTGFDLL